MDFDVDRVRSALSGREIEWLESTESTMRVAADRVRQGCPHGTIIGAEQQTAGVGRHGKRWHSTAGEGLYISLVLHLKKPARELPIVMLGLGLAAQETIAQTSGILGDLRWPNDVLIGGKKLAGMLAQLEGDAVIAGIGINVAQREFPPDLETPATSLFLENAEIQREELLIGLVTSVDRMCDILTQRGAEAILRAFTAASSYAMGRRVRAEADGRAIEGVTCGLDPSGFLRVREDSGAVVTILAGGVRPV